MARRARSVIHAAVALIALGVTLAPRVAHAQADVNPPLPNALLLVDTSGSMESQTNGSSVTCSPGNTAGVNNKSRWIDLVEVLTGTIQDYSCQEINRLDSTIGFKTGEYALNGDPYDFRYPIPYHRPLSGGCAPAPGVQNANPFKYPTLGGVSYHTYNGNASCTFSQPGNDGVLDVFQDFVRFGLMTFDTSTDPGTGFDGVMETATANSATGKAGLWSYVVGASATGMPSGCTTGTKPEEVGARNAAAPPWEGRMVNFGNPNDGTFDYASRNAHIQEVLLATRPYGATPIAGMLKDAQDFLLNDKTSDPDRNPTSLSTSDVAGDFGPYRDPYLNCGRKQIVVLLTDGQPNMDLRPYCDSNTETPHGVCPFQLPETITASLDTAGPSHAAIPTYVVGFALDKVDDDNNPATPDLDCNTITNADVTTTSSTNLCNKAANAGNLALQACCTLQRIAIAGGTTAFFANNRETLRSQLSQILSTQQTATSRTQPVTAAGGGGTFRFFSGFKPGNLRPWTGTLERQRYVCQGVSVVKTAAPVDIDPLLGDNFVHNVSEAGPDARRVYTMVGGSTSAQTIDSLASIRPYIGATDLDGIGTYGGRSRSGKSSDFVSVLEKEALAIPTTSCIDQTGAALPTGNACRDMYLNWWLGLPNGQSKVKSRCPSPGPTCELVGDIIHSTPLVVDRPNAAIRDESYARFQLLQAARPLMLYTSSNDGLLHAFKVASNNPADTSDTSQVKNDKASNELWTFVPPEVLPNLYHLYPYNHQVLLDGKPAFQDVVAVQPTQADQLPVVFERTAADARAGAAAWRTVLVQGLGSSHSGYFALDITTPELNGSSPDDVTKGGPRMLWQLTRDSHGKNLFGRGGSTPLITTLFMDPSGTSNPREIPVAVLPGGPGGTQDTTSPGCPAAGDRSYTDLPLDPDYPPRGRVHCYSFPNDESGARSLTIVRLDTGELIRTFRLSKTEVSSELQARTTEAFLDAPITGQPVAYPGFVGQVADRIYVGDAEGRLFKVDVSSSDPANWTMKLFHDLYPANLKAQAGYAFDAGQAIVLPPAVTVNTAGDIVLYVATGQQEVLASAPTLDNYLVSLTEKVNSAHTGTDTKVNWYQKFTDGITVMGPMQVFGGQLFFATQTPPKADSLSQVCTDGIGTIYSADTPPAGYDPASGAPNLLKLDSFPAQTAGLAVIQEPPCDATTDDLLGDPVLGYGHQVRLSSINTGKFKVVYQTGALKTSDTTTSVGVREKEIAAPQTLSAIESWASIVE